MGSTAYTRTHHDIRTDIERYILESRSKQGGQVSLGSALNICIFRI